MLAPAVVGTLVEELRWMVAVGEVAKTHQGCLSSPARLCPRDLGSLALYACLLFALPVGGGEEYVVTGRGCAMGVVLGVYTASHPVARGAVALAVDCFRLVCAVAPHTCYRVFFCMI